MNILKKSIRRILYILIFLTAYCKGNIAQATHIVGGVLYYEVLQHYPSTDEYDVRFKMYAYRDVINGIPPFDDPAYFTIFKGAPTGQFYYYNNITSRPISIMNVPMQITNPCLVAPPNVAVEEGIYSFVVRLPYNPDGYQVSYQRCCRNNTISNLVAPSDEGATYTVVLTGHAMRIMNSTPMYNNFPPIAICQNQALEFDHGATDANGHTITYSLCTPFHGGTELDPAPYITSTPPYTPIRFSAPFSSGVPMPSTPAMQVDPNTGFMTAYPTTLGQYVVGVCMREYDANGILISEVMRDFQFNVAYCQPRVIALMEADSVSADSNHFYFWGCESRNINFVNKSRERNAISSYKWELSNQFTSTITAPSVNLNTHGNYTGILVANPGSTGCTDTAFIHVQIAPRPNANFNLVIDSCAIDALVEMQITTTNTNAAYPVTNTINWGGAHRSINQNSIIYQTPGQYTIQLISKVNRVCSTSISKTTAYYPPLNASFTQDRREGCTPLNINFTNTTPLLNNLPNYTSTWDFGNNTPSVQSRNSAYNYSTSGSFVPILTIESPWGCISTATGNADALPGPIVSFSYAYDTCTPEPIRFTSTSSPAASNSPLVSWTWDMNNGTILNGEQATYEYDESGTYNVNFTVADANGCATSIVQQVRYYPAPIIADFFANPNICQGDIIDFSNMSQPVNEDYTFRWNFGDGGTAQDMNPSYQFNRLGSFNSSLFIQSPIGCIATYNKVIYVHEAPKASFTLDFDSCAYTPINLNNTSQTNTAGTALVSQNLNLGNGNMVNNFSIHQEPYIVRNDYDIYLYIEDANGCKDTAYYDLAYYPSIVFDVPSHSQEACAPLSLTFTNNELNDYPGYIFDWRLANGVQSSDFEPVYTYTERGVYYPTLRIISPTGCVVDFRDTLIIRGTPTAKIAYEYDSCALEPVVFRNLSTPSLDAPINTIFWDFGDGNTGNNPIERHNYTYPRDTGIFNVVLRVSDQYGCEDDTTLQLKWAPYPIFDIVLANTEGCIPLKAPLPIDFPYPMNNYRYEWNFGDGNRSSAAALAEDYTYTTAGTFTRTFKVVAPNGCTGNYSSQHIAKPVPIADFNYTPRELNIFAPQVNFQDQSIDAAMWEWHFGLGRLPDYKYMQNPSFHYRDTGQFVVQLVATHINGCTDTIQKTLDIIPKFTYFLPNAFTPNGDGTNDGFRGTGLMQYIAEFEMQIYNRWGEMVFITNNPMEAWNGRKGNTGEMCQSGVYVVQVILKGFRGEEQVEKGFATLIH